ncbi:MAG: hypothetical protein ISR85_00165 [Kiritimatiellales bacterium]|nr:hypothetical protein [Kiritimatiellota bacterium]MBL7011326.1 hypothetical protein [Kiritimatiellales bacterium]
MSESASPAFTRNPILWGAYLACSWTWCIGMFLPALLLRDMGWAGFLIFAIPNVIGAAAMGWVIQSRADSARFVDAHLNAIWWFSAITLAFHLFWILWITSFIRAAFHIPTLYLAGGIGLSFLFALISQRGNRRGQAPQIALALLLFSLGVFIATICTPDVQKANTALLASADHSMAPLWMLPVMLFGFLLCPYLDITFHHARQQLDTEKNGRLGFSIGFIGFFTFMILLTTRYAGVIANAADGTCLAPIATPWLATGILIHILCQWLFTVRAHLDRIQTLPGAKSKRPLLLALALLSGLAGFLATRLPSHAGLAGGEIVYRLFMSAYGLLFPVYVLYRVVIKKKIGLPTLWIMIALASPLFWMGFIERQPIWLVPGMGLILLGIFIRLPKRSQN